LQQREANGEIARRLGNFLLTDRTLVAPFTELGNNGREQLDHDRTRDVGHNAQPKDGEAREGTTREEVQESEYATGPGLGLERLHLGPTDTGNRKVGP
jgi:hypothetical protein